MDENHAAVEGTVQNADGGEEHAGGRAGPRDLSERQADPGEATGQEQTDTVAPRGDKNKEGRANEAGRLEVPAHELLPGAAELAR